MSRTTHARRRITTALGATVLALGLGAVALAAGAAPAAAGPTNLPGVPAAGSSADVWEAWADDELAKARATDWDADSASRGCVLQDATVSTEVDADYNAAMGAPADLETARVELDEDCSGGAAAAEPSTSDGSKVTAKSVTRAAAASLPTGSQCASTTGPGTLCLWKESGRVYAAWGYEGSGTVKGFLRIYQISTSSSGCPSGTTWLTGAESSWSNGTTRTISKTQTQNGGYSAYIWKKVTIGHTTWGKVCSTL